MVYNHYVSDNHLFLNLGNSINHTKFRHIILNTYTLELIAEINDCDHHYIDVCHLRDNYVVIIATGCYSDVSNKLIIANVTDDSYVCTQTIDINSEKIRTATKYKNGLVTVNYLSEIKVYDYV